MEQETSEEEFFYQVGLCKIEHRERLIKENRVVRRRVLRPKPVENYKKLFSSEKPLPFKKKLTENKQDFTKAKPDQYDTCEKIFLQPSNSEKHKQTHVGAEKIPVHQCHLCKKKFLLLSSLKTHQQTQIDGEKLFQCCACKKTFSSKGNLVVHERVHTGEKPYQCSTCGKTFSQSSSLTTHKRIHLGEKPFQCLLCKKFFSDRSNLRKHERTHV